MVSYLEQVQAQSDMLLELRNLAQCKSEANDLKVWSDRMIPLEDRVAKLLANLPDELQAQGLSLEALRRLLAGKWRGNCHPGELGAALRKLGYERRRMWSDPVNGYKAKWFLQK
jgi:hypothetical protein